MKNTFLWMMTWLAVLCFAPNGFAITYSTLNPADWSVGDADSTYQEWKAYESAFAGSIMSPAPTSALYTNNTPMSSDPSLNAVAPGFKASSGGYYSFSAPYGVASSIFNHGGTFGTSSYPVDFGTHVIVQTGASTNEDLSVFSNSLNIVQPNGNPIAGGANSEMLQHGQFYLETVTLPSLGEQEFQGLIWEFWLPGYTGDFKVESTSNVHSAFQALRVDTKIAGASGNGGSPFSLVSIPVPEPSSILLSLSSIGLGILAIRRSKLLQLRS